MSKAKWKTPPDWTVTVEPVDDVWRVAVIDNTGKLVVRESSKPIVGLEAARDHATAVAKKLGIAVREK